MTKKTKTDIPFKIITGRDNPELVNETQKRISAEWPEFMLHDPVANGLVDCYAKLPDFQFVLVDTASDEVVSIANSIPLQWNNDIAALPDDGWDWALTQGLDDFAEGRQPNLLCALQIVVFGNNRGRGISYHTVQAMKTNGASHGLTAMIAPVRPSRKCDHPEIPIVEYIEWKRDDGLPTDPWLRVHARAGATIVKPCPTAMRIGGTVAEWESWTGMKFPRSDDYIVPGALVPVKIDIEKDRGLYIEPNVWMHHPPE